MPLELTPDEVILKTKGDIVDSLQGDLGDSDTISLSPHGNALYHGSDPDFKGLARHGLFELDAAPEKVITGLGHWSVSRDMKISNGFIYSVMCGTADDLRIFRKSVTDTSAGYGTQIYSDATTSTGGIDLMISPDGTKIAVVVQSQNSIYYSANSGTTFIKSANSYSNGRLASVNNQGIITIGNWLFAQAVIVNMSTDNITTMAGVKSSFGVHNQAYMWTDPDDWSNAWHAYQTGIARTKDGTSWQTVSSHSSNLLITMVGPGIALKAKAVGANIFIDITYDGGESWSTISRHLTTEVFNSIDGTGAISDTLRFKWYRSPDYKTVILGISPGNQQAWRSYCIPFYVGTDKVTVGSMTALTGNSVPVRFYEDSSRTVGDGYVVEYTLDSASTKGNSKMSVFYGDTEEIDALPKGQTTHDVVRKE